MKKTYQQPTLVVMTISQSLPIALSLGVDNGEHNGVQGDVKGDWGDIWDEQPAATED